LETTFKTAGKSIGGGKLTKVLRGGKVVGTINELSVTGFFMAHNNPAKPGEAVLCYSMEAAKQLF
jgi:hypothetical protein